MTRTIATNGATLKAITNWDEIDFIGDTEPVFIHADGNGPAYATWTSERGVSCDLGDITPSELDRFINNSGADEKPSAITIAGLRAADLEDLHTDLFGTVTGYRESTQPEVAEAIRVRALIRGEITKRQAKEKVTP